jgi:hypothetical protein
MATTTPNFGWAVPTSTDLVKDGAVAIETLGDSIDASLVDLKGGTTGQVLAKASNTDMDFSWVAQDDSNAIQNAIVDAKGDLIAATANDTPARLAVGTNGQVLTADSTAATGLAWAAPAATSGPAFRAYRSGSAQTFNANTATKVQLNAESFDTDSCFDSTTNYRFTPTKAGYYQMSANIQFAGSTATTIKEIYIYKNGSENAKLYSSNGSGVPGASFQGGSSTLIYFNGSTDYSELYVYDSDGVSRSVYNGETLTYFSGVWIRS